MTDDGTLHRALVTGASGGIGEAIARKLCMAGVRVCLTGRNQEKLEELVKDLGSDSCCFIVKDLYNNEHVDSMIADAEEQLGGKISILINNAGFTADSLAIRMSREDWSDVINVNLTSTFILSKGVLRSMMKQKWGRIVNITSVVGFSGNPGQANYAAAKAGMIAMSKTLASEVATRGITVNCVAPGFIKTDMTDNLPEAVRDNILSRIPLARYGTPEEVASVVEWLASEDSSYITGETIHVNGGMLMA